MITNNQYELDKALISIKREKQTVLKWLMRGITEQKKKEIIKINIAMIIIYK